MSQPVTDTNFGTDGNKFLIAPYSSQPTAYTHWDGLALSIYYTISEFNIPSNWLTNADGGLSSLYGELNGQQLANNQIAQSSGAITNSGGTGYTCASSYPCSYGYVPLIGGHGAGARCQFSVSSLGVPTCDMSAGQANGGQNYTVSDTLTVSNTNLGGSGSGWSGTVATVTGVDAPESAIASADALINAWKTYGTTYGLPVYGYEAGEQILLNNGASPLLTMLCAWDSWSGAEFHYDIPQRVVALAWSKQCLELFPECRVVSLCRSWGLLYNPGQSPLPPKFLGALQLIQFLLKRDLDPASNDNTPAFLLKVG